MTAQSNLTWHKELAQLKDLYQIKKKRLSDSTKKSFKLEKENKKLTAEVKKLKNLKQNETVREEKLQELTLENKKLKEEKDRTYDVSMKSHLKQKECNKLKEEVEELKRLRRSDAGCNKRMMKTAEENLKLKEEIQKLQQEKEILKDLLQERIPQGCIAETTYQPILDENEQLKEEKEDAWEKGYETCKNDTFELYEKVEELKEERGDILDLIGADDDTSPKDLYTMLEEMNSIHNKFLENESLGEKVELLKQKATAWDIVNNGTDWKHLRDLCDKGMCEGLIECGECEKVDFEGYDYDQLS